MGKWEVSFLDDLLFMLGWLAFCGGCLDFLLIANCLFDRKTLTLIGFFFLPLGSVSGCVFVFCVNNVCLLSLHNSSNLPIIQISRLLLLPRKCNNVENRCNFNSSPKKTNNKEQTHMLLNKTIHYTVICKQSNWSQGKLLLTYCYQPYHCFLIVTCNVPQESFLSSPTRFGRHSYISFLCFHLIDNGFIIHSSSIRSHYL